MGRAEIICFAVNVAFVDLREEDRRRRYIELRIVHVIQRENVPDNDLAKEQATYEGYSFTL